MYIGKKDIVQDTSFQHCQFCIKVLDPISLIMKFLLSLSVCKLFSNIWDKTFTFTPEMVVLLEYLIIRINRLGGVMVSVLASSAEGLTHSRVKPKTLKLVYLLLLR